jgi:hypothetical protein
MTKLKVDCRPGQEVWSCDVAVGDDPGATRHRVSVSEDTLARLAPGASEPTQLVRASFEFLLEREPRESILHSFELPLIGRYFPEYEATIRQRVGQ